MGIDVNFERHFEDDEGKPSKKTVNKALFAKMNPYPQKKIMTFNKFQDDFQFNANLNNLDHLEKNEISNVGSQSLHTYTVIGLKKAMENNTGDNIESKGVKAHFNLDDNGLLSVTAVEAAFEQTISVEQQIKEYEEKLAKEAKDGDKTLGEDGDDTWSKTLGDSISSFFGDKDEEGKDSTGEKDPKENDPKSKEKESEDKKKKEKEDKKKKEKEEKKKKEAEKKKEKEKPKEPKIIHIKEPLQFESTVVDLVGLTKEQFNVSKEKLDKLNEVDQIKQDRETALNDLESFVLNVREKLYEELFEKSSTEEEREKIREKCSELSDWIDEEAGPFTEVEVLKSKLDELKTLTKDLFARVEEHQGRPEILEALNSMVNSSEHFLGKAKNDTKNKAPEDAYFTESELELLEKKINETKNWIEEKTKVIEAQPLHEFPTINNKLIAVQGMDLDREVKYLVNKAKIAKQERDRLKKEQAKKDKKAKANTTKDDEKLDTKAEEETETEEEVTEENLDESFGEDTMGGPEDSNTGETNADESDENGDDTIEVQNEATDKQASDSDVDSETENKEEEETPKEEL